MRVFSFLILYLPKYLPLPRPKRRSISKINEMGGCNVRGLKNLDHICSTDNSVLELQLRGEYLLEYTVRMLYAVNGIIPKKTCETIKSTFFSVLVFFSIQLECLVPTLKGMVAQLHPPYEQEGSNSCERSNSSKLESVVPGSDQFRACDRHPSRSNKHPQTF